MNFFLFDVNNDNYFYCDKIEVIYVCFFFYLIYLVCIVGWVGKYGNYGKEIIGIFFYK